MITMKNWGQPVDNKIIIVFLIEIIAKSILIKLVVYDIDFIIS
jgi:hypothetical protein